MVDFTATISAATATSTLALHSRPRGSTSSPWTVPSLPGVQGPARSGEIKLSGANGPLFRGEAEPKRAGPSGAGERCQSGWMWRSGGGSLHVVLRDSESTGQEEAGWDAGTLERVGVQQNPYISCSNIPAKVTLERVQPLDMLFDIRHVAEI